MDDFNISSLHESKNEWGARLITMLTPLIIEGFKSIFDESYKLCRDNGETDKYLMTFQNFIARIPKWNPTIIENEKKRIIDKSGCTYLEDLITCVHIIQLKILTAMRVGQKQKKIDINIPKIDDFIHKAYINSARKIYKNVYLFELGIPALQMQKQHRELEIIIQECILNTVRESIPIESILRAYMDETVEEEVVEEVKEQKIVEQKPVVSQHISENSGSKPAVVPDTKPISAPSNSFVEPSVDNITKSFDNITNIKKIDTNDQFSQSAGSRLSFNDDDRTINGHGQEEIISAPKTIERLEEISNLRNIQRRMENDEDEEDDRIQISDQSISLNDFDVHNIDEPISNLIPDLIFDDVEILA